MKLNEMKFTWIEEFGQMAVTEIRLHSKWDLLFYVEAEIVD